MTLQCALSQRIFSQTSGSFTGTKADQKRLEIKAKQDAWNQIRSAPQSPLMTALLDDCPSGCDRINNAQAPRVYVFSRQWTRTPSGGSITVQVTFQYYLIYACGNH